MKLKMNVTRCISYTYKSEYKDERLMQFAELCYFFVVVVPLKQVKHNLLKFDFVGHYWYYIV